jgi:hypothetical protein
MKAELIGFSEKDGWQAVECTHDEIEETTSQYDYVFPIYFLADGAASSIATTFQNAKLDPMTIKQLGQVMAHALRR